MSKKIALMVAAATLCGLTACNEVTYRDCDDSTVVCVGSSSMACYGGSYTTDYPEAVNCGDKQKCVVKDKVATCVSAEETVNPCKGETGSAKICVGSDLISCKDGAVSSKTTCSGDKPICNSSSSACESDIMAGSCSLSCDNIAHASNAVCQLQSTGPVCVVSACESGYKVSDDKKSCVEDVPAPSCSVADDCQIPDGSHATEMACNNDACEIAKCESGYKVSDDKKSCVEDVPAPSCSVADDCQIPDGSHATEMACNNDACEIAKCADGYKVSDDKKNCESEKLSCTVESISGTVTVEHGDLYCVDAKTVGECQNGVADPQYGLCSDGLICDPDKVNTASGCTEALDPTPKCSVADDCQIPDGSHATEMACNNEVCEIAKCADGYKVSDDKASCVEDVADAECTASDVSKCTAVAGSTPTCSDDNKCVYGCGDETCELVENGVVTCNEIESAFGTGYSCELTACADGYKLNDAKDGCVNDPMAALSAACEGVDDAPACVIDKDNTSWAIYCWNGVVDEYYHCGAENEYDDYTDYPVCSIISMYSYDYSQCGECSIDDISNCQPSSSDTKEVYCNIDSYIPVCAERCKDGYEDDGSGNCVQKQPPVSLECTEGGDQDALRNECRDIISSLPAYGKYTCINSKCGLACTDGFELNDAEDECIMKADLSSACVDGSGPITGGVCAIDNDGEEWALYCDNGVAQNPDHCGVENEWVDLTKYPKCYMLISEFNTRPACGQCGADADCSPSDATKEAYCDVSEMYPVCAERCKDGYEDDGSGNCVQKQASGCSNAMDCSDFPAHSATMTCLNSQCVVNSCYTGWKVSDDKLSCVEDVPDTECVAGDDQAALATKCGSKVTLPTDGVYACQDSKCAVACANGYKLSDDKASCVEDGGSSSSEPKINFTTATFGKNGFCGTSQCPNNYTTPDVKVGIGSAEVTFNYCNFDGTSKVLICKAIDGTKPPENSTIVVSGLTSVSSIAFKGILKKGDSSLKVVASKSGEDVYTYLDDYSNGNLDVTINSSATFAEGEWSTNIDSLKIEVTKGQVNFSSIDWK